MPMASSAGVGETLTLSGARLRMFVRVTIRVSPTRARRITTVTRRRVGAVSI
jgi:hypothetical protein